MNILFHAHSGIRYLVLLAAVVALAVFALGLIRKTPYGKGARVAGSAFVGLLDLQLLLGLVMVAFGRFFPALWGHIILAVLATGVAHAGLVVNRRRPAPGHALPLVVVLVALVLVIGGILAIGRRVI